MPERKGKQNQGFAFRIRVGDYEIELEGTHEEVLKTLETLPSLVTNVHKAFEVVKPKTIATLTVKTQDSKDSEASETPEVSVHDYPKVRAVRNVKDAVLRLLETDWGKWRPRTMGELEEAMKANGLKFAGNSLEQILGKLADEGMIRRWNTNTGFVYILAEEKSVSSGDED